MNGNDGITQSLIEQLYAHWGKTMFPDVELKLAIEGQNIKYFDVFRRKWLVLTPEEWVRQHFAHWLADSKSISRGMIRLEQGLVWNGMSKRADVVVYKPDQTVLLLAEIKAPFVQLNESTVKQMATYHQNIQADWLAVSNGISSYFWQRQADNGWVLINKENWLAL
jgi:hypothetical protein